MAGEVKDECGVAAVYLPKKLDKYPVGGASYYLYQMLLQMQNRGQLATGITTYNGDRKQLIDTFRKRGSVSEAFSTKIRPKARAIMEKYSGTKGIGHVRYSTSGADDIGSTQPFERHHGRKWKWFSFAFNGNLANFSELKKELEDKQYHLVRNLDTEVIMHFLEKEQVGEKKKPITQVFADLSDKFDGAYNMVYINAEGTVTAMRDPVGVRPLCYVIDDDFVGAASESVAMANLVTNEIKDLKPGEMLISDESGVEVKTFKKSKKIAHCMFEYVYFANAASTIDGKSVYQVRWRLGQELAKQENLETTGDDWIVVPVPDTAKPIADAYAHALGLPVMEGLVRNRYVGRTFIETNDRMARIKEKFNLNKSVLKDKKVILVDDSIVRGSTSQAIVQYLKEKGMAKEIHMRVSCPPIRSPCFYGIDMSTIGELIANRNSTKEQINRIGFEDVDESVIQNTAKEIKVDSLQYMSLNGLIKAINLENGKDDLCLACITGEYPTEWGTKLRVKAIERHERGLEAERTYS
ncbi:MAG: amidophosphoribosyltransferase [archaeon]|nr:amidophosphoribosyltransferase [archaeon]